MLGEREERGISAQRLQALSGVTNTIERQGDGHTALRMDPILFTYRFKKVERLTNLLSDPLTHARTQPNFHQDTVDQQKVCGFEDDVSSLPTFG